MNVMPLTDDQKKYLWARRLLSWINFDLWILNWFVVPVKVLLFIAVSLLTRIVEPYKRADYPAPLNMFLDGLRKLIVAWNEQFVWSGVPLSGTSSLPPNGQNHDYGDWCLFAGYYAAMKALGRPDQWIDDNGYLFRGWIRAVGDWYDYRISGDQIAGFVFGIAMGEWVGSKVQFIQFVDRIILDGYVINDPAEGRTYWRDYRMGLIMYGGMLPSILAILTLAYQMTGDRKYLWARRRYYWKAAGLLLMFPVGKPFELLDGSVFNVTFLGLAAYAKLSGSRAARFGMRWTWWINRLVYNPFWNILTEYITGKPCDRDMAKWGLGSVNPACFRDYSISGPGASKWSYTKRYFRLFGKRYAVFPPPYSDQWGDTSQFQRIQREVSTWGLKDFNDATEYYAMVDWLLTYDLLKKLEARG